MATATATVTATATATMPPAGCNPRPSVGVTTAQRGLGRLRVTLSTTTVLGTAANWLTELRVTDLDNGTVEIANPPTVVDRPTVVPLPSQPTQLSLVIQRQTPGVASTVHFVARDRCGEWPTFAGGGPNAF